MICLVLGTPDSGKSKRAEDLVMELAGAGKKYYIATMIPFGEEGKKRVEKHRKMREGKGFETIECTTKVHELSDTLQDLEASTCLLECMSNLVGNEMHEERNLERSSEELADYIADSVISLSKKSGNMVLVANTFPLDGEGYDEDTRKYVRIVDLVNQRLRKKVDEVYELI